MKSFLLKARKNSDINFFTGWLIGDYPTVTGETVTRSVCFQTSIDDTCKDTETAEIKIKNCDDFFLFKLVDRISDRGE